MKTFVDNPAPGCGRKSLHIGGGCLQPVLWTTLPPQREDGYYSLSLWGLDTGAIVLTTSEPYDVREEIEILVLTNEWTYFESEDSLFCSSKDSLKIEIYSGGYVPQYIYIDCLKVERLE